MRSSRFVALIVISLVLGSAPAVVSAETELRVLEFLAHPDYVAFFEWVADEFEKEHPDVSVSYEFLSFAAMREKLLVSMAAGAPPDVARISSVWMGEMTSAGLLESWSDEDLVGVDLKRIVPSVLAQATVDGRFYGLPVSVDGNGIYYNKSIFAEHGLSTERDAMQTWDDLAEFAAKATRRDEDGRVLRYGFVFVPANRQAGDTFLAANSVPFLIEGPDGLRAGFNTPAGIRTLEFLKEMLELYGHPSPGVGYFGEERAAMQFQSVQTSSRYRTTNPTLDFGMTNVPPGPDGSQRASLVWSHYYSIPVGAPNEEIAREFIRFVHSLRVQEEALARLGVLETPRLDIVETDTFFSMLHENPWLADVPELLASARPDLTIQALSDVNNVWGALIPPALQGHTPIASALAEAERLINQLLER